MDDKEAKQFERELEDDMTHGDPNVLVAPSLMVGEKRVLNAARRLLAHKDHHGDSDIRIQ